MNKLNWRTVAVLGGALTLVSAAFVAGRALAAGIPTAAPVLNYSGQLDDADGSPLSGDQHNVAIKLWNAESKGTAVCDTGTPTPLVLDAHGGFSVALDICVDAIKANPNLWAEVLVDGASLGRAKLGAVPYSLEAGHATTADNAASATNAVNATKVPWSGVSGVPVGIAANNGSITIGGSNRVLTAGNESGNLHIDSTTGSKAGALFLNYYAGTSVIFGNGAGAAVGSVDSSGNANLNGNMKAGGYYSGPAGSGGGVIRDRGNDNGVSFDWDGGTLRFYVENVNVKNFIIAHPTDAERYLVHTTLEGPENAVFYRGTARLKAGVAEVTLPSYFEAATRAEGRTVLLTPKFEDAAEPLSALAASSIRKGTFVVRAIGKDNPNQVFDWEVKAVRKDVAQLTPEPKRDSIVVHGDGPYKYYSVKR